VDEGVTFQVPTLCEASMANITNVRLLSSVGAHVLCQCVFRCEAFLTDVTLVRFLSGVNAHVFCQWASFSEAFPTDMTLVRFLTVVSAFVSDHVVQSREAFHTGITLKWLLSRFVASWNCHGFIISKHGHWYTGRVRHSTSHQATIIMLWMWVIHACDSQ